MSSSLLRVAALAALVGAAPAQAEWLYGRLLPVTPGTESNGYSEDVDVSSDGRTVVFASGATNWLPDDPSTTTKAIAVDLDTGVLEIVSRTTAGTIVRGDSPVVSRDGRYVAFLNFGGDLGVGVPTSGWQVVRKDRVTGELRLVSAGASGEAANNFVDDDTVSISGDGRYVAFEASSSNLGIATGGHMQVLVKDMETGALALASASSAGVASAGDCTLWPHALSDDGRFVTFVCDDELVPGADVQQVYVRDLALGTTELVSRASGVAGAPSTAFSGWPAIAPGGRFVVFRNPAYGGLGGDPAVHSGIYLRDRTMQATLSLPSPVGANAGGCSVPDVSDAGTVVMQCTTTSAAQVYLYVPGATATPVLVSSDAGDAPGDAGSGDSLAVDASGLSMTFESLAGNLAPDDGNDVSDVFVLVDSSVISGIFADGFED